MEIQTDGKVYVASIDGNDVKDPKTMEAFTDFLNAEQDYYDAQIKEIATQLNVSNGCASDVLYLRTRSRHTPELEAELIRLHKEGSPPNICDFGVTEGSQQRLKEHVEELTRRFASTGNPG